MYISNIVNIIRYSNHTYIRQFRHFVLLLSNLCSSSGSKFITSIWGYLYIIKGEFII